LLDYKNDCIYAVGRPDIRKGILVGSFEVATVTFWYELRSAPEDTVMPVMVMETVASAATPALATGNGISDAISAADLLTGEDAIAELAMLADDAVVNTPAGNVILIESALVIACEIFIVIVKVPVVHTAELPWEESAPPEDAHSPLAASHVVPTSQHPGP
jgi:hypothetical protein